jgi:Ca2+-binding RTX toxin-like protein
MSIYRSTWAKAGTGVATLLLSGAGMFLGTATAANAAPAQPPAPVTCGGLTAADALAAGYTPRDSSASAFGVIVLGGPGPDWMVGSDFADILDGQGGDDLICGRNGADDLRGLSGDDRIFGGGGNDAISGGANTDVGNGGNGANNICDASTETQNNC